MKLRFVLPGILFLIAVFSGCNPSVPNTPACQANPIGSLSVINATGECVQLVVSDAAGTLDDEVICDSLAHKQTLPGGDYKVHAVTQAGKQVVMDTDVTVECGGTAELTLNPPSTAAFRGVNVVGMEMAYTSYSQGSGPVADTHYPVIDTRLIDYLASKHVNAIRFLFSWEGMQSVLNGPIPASDSGNYKAYYDNYKRIVDYATQTKGMRVIIEPWQADSAGGAGGARWRGDLVGSDAVPTSAFADLWAKMATHFAGNSLVSFGLVNEPNSMSTMSWWASAQAAVTAIRGAGATQRIHVPGNGWTGASSWTSSWYDTAPVQRSNAYGWLNANGVGSPISDPLSNIVAEIHTYVDAGEGGATTEITSATAAREHVAVALNEAAAHGYKIYLGEIGFYAGMGNATAAWADFIAYFKANPEVFTGFTWWAAGSPGWWDDVGANGGGHFSVTPTNGTTFSGDTVNMTMIQSSF